MKKSEQNKIIDLHKKIAKTSTMHNNYCKQMRDFIIDKIQFEDDEWHGLTHDDIKFQSSVFWQPTDGMVFELCSRNAPLTKVLEHILSHDVITLDEYLYYAV